MAEQLYALEKLYEDQEPDLVTDTIPAVLAWLGRNGEGPALSFSVRIGAKPAKEETLRLGYDGRVLEQLAGLPATIEAGFDRRMVQMATRYDEWWASSKTRIESATEKLSQGLMMASLVIAQNAVNDGATDARGEPLLG